MTWTSWKPEDRRPPDGDWRQFMMADRVVGLKYRRDSVFAFVRGVMAADRKGSDWGIELEREPGNPHSPNGTATKVIGRWVERRLSLFRGFVKTVRREHIGYLPGEMTEALWEDFGKLFHSVPLAAELYEIALAEGAERRTDVMGVIVKVIVLLPSKRDPVWGTTRRQSG